MMLVYKILVVDDERDVVGLLKDYFEMNNYFVITAYTGAEAIEKISKNQNPDIIRIYSEYLKYPGSDIAKEILHKCKESVKN